MLALVVLMGLVGLVYVPGIILAVSRHARDKARAGALNRHDGRVLALAPRGAAARFQASALRVFLEGERRWITRVSVDGLDLARELAFRIQGLTLPRGKSLDGRLVVDGTHAPRRAARLFARAEVRDALATLCGALASFTAVNLYPGGNLVVDVAPDSRAEADLQERLVRFAEALDDAIPYLDDDGPQLGAASGVSGSPATFSIEIRS